MLPPGVTNQCRLIIEFVKGRISTMDYLIETDKINKRLIANSKELTLEEFKKSDAFEHESLHIEVWRKYGFECKIYRLDKNIFNVPSNPIEDFFILKKAEVIRIMKEACFAPYSNGIRTGVTSDLLFYEAFCGNIKPYDIDNEYKMVKRKYKVS